ncbi:MAG: hypothetical protein ABFD89_23860 [Bryobacteraceae bacterium]
MTTATIGALDVTAPFTADQATTASHANHATTSSHALTADLATTATHALASDTATTASHALFADAATTAVALVTMLVHGDLLNLNADDHPQYILHTELDSEAELETALSGVSNVFTNNDTIPWTNVQDVWVNTSGDTMTGNLTAPKFISSNTTAMGPPMAVSSTATVTNLSADMIDQLQSWQLFCLSDDEEVIGIPSFNGGNSTIVTPPFHVDSNAVITNLNADLVDGKSESVFFTLSENETVSGITTFNAIPAFNGGTSGSSAPFTVDSTQVVANLNADLFDGHNSDYYAVAGGAGDLSAYFKLDENETVTGRPVFAGATISDLVPPFTLTGAYANTKVPNLNADLLDGISSAGFCASGTGDAGTLDTHDSTFFINGTSTAQTISTSLKVATPSSALSGASFAIDSTQTAGIQVPSGIAMYGYGQGNTSTDGFRITSSYHDYLGADTPVLLWNKENSDVQIGSNNLLGLTVSDDGVTVGAGTGGVDYTLAFNGESNDGAITFDEDNADFKFDQDLVSAGGIYAFNSTSGIRGSGGQLQVGGATVYTRYDSTPAIYTYLGAWSTAQTATVFYSYSDATVSLGSATRRWKGSHTFEETFYPKAEPAAPSAGVTLYVDSTSGDLMAKNSAGSLVTVANF